MPILEVSSVLRPSGRLNQAPTIVYRFCGSSFYGKFQLWYLKVPAVVLKNTSCGTQKYQLWYLKVPAVELAQNSSSWLPFTLISVPSSQCLFVPSPQCPPFVSLKILRKNANLTHNLTHYKHLTISRKDTKCVRFWDFLLNFITRSCTRGIFITLIARGRQITTGGNEEGEEWGIGLQPEVMKKGRSEDFRKSFCA